MYDRSLCARGDIDHLSQSQRQVPAVTLISPSISKDAIRTTATTTTMAENKCSRGIRYMREAGLDYAVPASLMRSSNLKHPK
jgi:hypothetical protein